ncbi:type II secretion system protein [Planctomycetota bacterium]|nr:type II secretion system protein [Planctomycetota bacterium]
MAGKKENRRRNFGFSVMELLVAVGLVGILLGIVFAGYMKLKEGGEAATAKSLLAGLNGVATQYELKVGRVIDHTINKGSHVPFVNDKAMPGKHIPWWNGGDPVHKNAVPPNTSGAGAEITPSRNKEIELVLDPAENTLNFDNNTKCTLANGFIERFVFATYRIPDIKGSLQRLGGDAFVDIDEDGSGDGFYEIRDPWGQCIIYVYKPQELNATSWLPTHSTPYFASAGPDGVWGIDPRSVQYTNSGLSATDQNRAKELSNDNIYSFELEEAAK